MTIIRVISYTKEYKIRAKIISKTNKEREDNSEASVTLRAKTNVSNKRYRFSTQILNTNNKLVKNLTSDVASFDFDDSSNQPLINPDINPESSSLTQHPVVQQHLTTEQLIVSNQSQASEQHSIQNNLIVTQINTKITIVRYTIQNLLDLAKIKKFPKTEFIISGKKKNYAECLQFFTLPSYNFPQKPTQNLLWTCCGCNQRIEASLGSTTSLNRHLRELCRNSESKIWYQMFQNKTPWGKKISKEMLFLIKYFITANEALKSLNNPYLKELMSLIPKFIYPTVHIFRYNFLPSVFQMLKELIEQKLNDCVTICIIIDLWANLINKDYLGIGATLSDIDFDREIIVLNMIRMEGSHNAKNVKIAVEKGINAYKFDKSKVHGNPLYNMYIKIVQ